MWYDMGSLFVILTRLAAEGSTAFSRRHPGTFQWFVPAEREKEIGI